MQRRREGVRACSRDGIERAGQMDGSLNARAWLYKKSRLLLAIALQFAAELCSCCTGLTDSRTTRSSVLCDSVKSLGSFGSAF